MTASSDPTSDPRSRPNGQRKRRFRREPEGAIQITERDLAIVRLVCRHRFLRSTHLLALVGGGQGLIRRLADLYHHAYLDRPREQIEFYQNAGSKPMVYAVGNRGADLLAREDGLPRGKVNWTAKNHAIGPLFLEHTLLVSDVLVAMALACRENGRVRLVPAEEIVARAPEATRKRLKPFQWTVTGSYQGEKTPLGVVPDGMFGLQYLDKPEGRNTAYFFLEADRATMPIFRKGVRQTSFFRKLVAYHETWKQGIHTSVYGIKNFRVLTVTTSPERVENLVRANRAVNEGKGSRLFLFTDETALRTAPDLLALDWRNGEDATPVRLGA